MIAVRELRSGLAWQWLPAWHGFLLRRWTPYQFLYTIGGPLDHRPWWS